MIPTYRRSVTVAEFPLFRRTLLEIKLPPLAQTPPHTESSLSATSHFRCHLLLTQIPKFEVLEKGEDARHFYSIQDEHKVSVPLYLIPPRISLFEQRNDIDSNQALVSKKQAGCSHDSSRPIDEHNALAEIGEGDERTDLTEAVKAAGGIHGLRNRTEGGEALDGECAHLVSGAQNLAVFALAVRGKQGAVVGSRHSRAFKRGAEGRLAGQGWIGKAGEAGKDSTGRHSTISSRLAIIDRSARYRITKENGMKAASSTASPDVEKRNNRSNPGVTI